jgi:hypothetical protein
MAALAFENAALQVSEDWKNPVPFLSPYMKFTNELI